VGQAPRTVRGRARPAEDGRHASGFVRDHPGGSLLVVRVTPRAGRAAIGGERDGALLVRVAAPPVEGAANAAVIELVARALRLPRRAVSIIGGGRAREKRLAVAGLGPAEVAARLAPASRSSCQP